MKKLLKIVLVSSLSLLCFSCYYDNEEDFITDIPPDPDAEYKFASDITPIFVSYNCTDCHDGDRDPDLRAGNEYNSLVPDFVTPFDANASKFYTKLALNGHQDVDANSLAKIKKWINDGALNN